MPFCTNCGTKVEPSASFCHNCGTVQPRKSAQFTDLFEGLSDRAAAILCYIPVFGVIPAVLFLAAQRYRTNRRVRFDAFQALYLFLAWLIISSAAPSLFWAEVPGWGVERAVLLLLKLALFCCWIYLLIKAANQEQVKLPVIGDLAARSTSEQL